ncbi:MAG: sugar-phosphatase [Clostridiaceae bacterium]
MYKLIALDVDGTLLKEDKSISPAVKEAISKASAKGVKVVITTGRPVKGITKILDELDLRAEGDYAIGYNGGVIQKTHNEEVSSQILMPEGSFELLYRLSFDLNVHIHLLTSKEVITPNKDISHYTVLEAFMNQIQLLYKAPEEMVNIKDVNKIMLIDHPEVLDEAIKQLPDWVYEKFNLVKSAPYFLEILPKEVSKAVGVKMLADSLGIKQEEIIAVGDADNDLDMIEFAGLGVAMGNAFENVKAIANYISKTNEEDGVAHVINKFILDKEDDNEDEELAG